MAVAHSVGSDSIGTATHTTSHAHSGTPAGVLVFIVQDGTATSLTTSVTYGSLTLSSVANATESRTTGEEGLITTYFAGSGLPSGTQTVTHNRTTNSGVQSAMYVATVTADADTELAGAVTITGFGIPGLQSIQSTSATAAVRYAAAFSGRGRLGQVDPLSGTTQLREDDFGSTIGAYYRETTAGTGTRSIGWTHNSDDGYIGVYFAVQEEAPPTLICQEGSFALTGKSVTFSQTEVGVTFDAHGGTMYNLYESGFSSYNSPLNGNSAQGVCHFVFERDVSTSVITSVKYGHYTGTNINLTKVATQAMPSSKGVLTVWFAGANIPENSPTNDQIEVNKSNSSVETVDYGFTVNSVSASTKIQPVVFESNTLDNGTWTKSISNPSDARCVRMAFGLVRNGGSNSFVANSSTSTQLYESLALDSTYSDYGFLVQGDDSGIGSATFGFSELGTTQDAVAAYVVIIAAPELIANAGSFVLTGNDAELSKPRQLDLIVTAGSFALTGQAITFQYSRKLATGLVSFALTGKTATLQNFKALTVNSASFILTGQVTTFLLARSLDAGLASFVFNGLTATLQDTETLSANAASFAFTGNAAGLARQSKIASAAGAFALTGNAATLTAALKLIADAGEFILTGQAVNFTKQSRLQLSIGSFALTGNTTDLAHKRLFDVQAGSFALTGNTAVLRKRIALEVAAGSFVVSGQDIALERNYILSGEAASYDFLGVDVGFAEANKISPSAASFALTGNAATLKDAERLSADLQSFALTGNDAGLAVGSGLASDSGSYALLGNAATLRKTSKLTAELATYALQGQAANLLKAKRVALNVEAFALTGGAASLKAQRALDVTAQAFNLTGNDLGLLAGRVVAASAGTFALSGNDITLQDAERLAAEYAEFDFTGIDVRLFHDQSAVLGEYVLTGNLVTLEKDLRLSTTRGRFRAKFTGKRQVVFVF